MLIVRWWIKKIDWLRSNIFIKSSEKTAYEEIKNDAIKNEKKQKAMRKMKYSNNRIKRSKMSHWNLSILININLHYKFTL
jgi:hypothetical protein